MAHRNNSKSKPNATGKAAFYLGLLRAIKAARVPFRVGGTCALNVYLKQSRETKDLDLFCRPGDYPRILQAAADAGYKTEIEDERWIAKIRRGKHYCDVVFGSANMIAVVTDEWLKEIHKAKIFGVLVKLLPPTEMVWSKAFIMDRYKYDGNDIVHLFLRNHELINWRRLLSYMDQHWEVLLMHVLNFRYIYPSERDLIPTWVLDELLSRLKAQLKLPRPQLKVCRGRIFSRNDFQVDISEWAFADLVGEGGS